MNRLQKYGTHTCHAKQWPTPPSTNQIITKLGSSATAIGNCRCQDGYGNPYDDVTKACCLTQQQFNHNGDFVFVDGDHKVCPPIYYITPAPRLQIVQCSDLAWFSWAIDGTKFNNCCQPLTNIDAYCWN